ncbi:MULTISPECIES: biofilm formation regulator BssR [Tenebrionibacter/Tenebrionicola group]|jgi:biofilm regulator BssR|uniref:Uncharacterized protein n=2 Tax=Tenebrionibacter/Tenebrionicola group TaxID=2969848 RepID=A0A8K0XWZ3_9ENTR|nr:MULTISPECIES: biofilm formation regulator BssR [Tenebrionibacter/Tenebrionicola group]MBK4714812.1 hypothetical protein [Tenebrionibacter intestinalis]MBV4412263.1 hypothetical protein [Tenebrionicola larvae]MBV5095557.1 hypothetical protein [Tenebrionicola larvae]
MHVTNSGKLPVRRLNAAYRALFSTLQICRACGSVSLAESERLRDELFELNAQYRVFHSREGAQLSGQESEHLQHAMAALSHAALCLMSGPRDCPQWCSVDAKKLAISVEELGQALSALEQARAVISTD